MFPRTAPTVGWYKAPRVELNILNKHGSSSDRGIINFLGFQNCLIATRVLAKSFENRYIVNRKQIMDFLNRTLST